SLNLDCVFEGIETDMQLMEATLAGFNYVQGYLIARPAPLADLLAEMHEGGTPGIGQGSALAEIPEQRRKSRGLNLP
ncbi:hypothetical protein R5H29_06690, partial [Stenotrophomonas sp. A3_2]